MYNLAIRKCTSPALLAPRLKIFKLKYPAGDRTPDLLDQRQTCYHLSERGVIFSKIFYVLDVVYVKSNSISCYFSGLKVAAAL